MDPNSDIGSLMQQHARPLRRLAFELVRDATTADDAVQETWLQVLRHPPRRAAEIRGWLKTVLRHVVFRGQRGERRRERLEHEVAREPIGGDPAVHVARVELAARLLVAVRTLPEPYASTVWQRFFEDLPPSKMAALAGVPVATVKSRLQRGLQQLRERLREGGESSDWRGALALAFGLDLPKGTATAAAITTATGGAAMAVWGKSAATILIACIAAWWWWPPTTTGSAPSEASVDPRTAVARHDNSAPNIAATASRAAQSPTGDRTIAAASEAPANLPTATVRGRCVDARGTPLAGCRVRVVGQDNGGRLDEWLRDHPDPNWRDLEQTTAADGVFVFPFWPPPPLKFTLRVERAGSSPLEGGIGIGPGALLDVGDVLLPDGIVLTGTVVDARQRPVAGVEVAANVKGERRGFAFDAESTAARPAVAMRAVVPHTCSDASGRFRFTAALTAGRWSLHLVHGGAWRDPFELELRPERTIEDVTLACSLPADAPTIGGRVVDADGLPVAGAWLRCGPDAVDDLPLGRSGPDGTFCLRRTPDPRLPDAVVLRAAHTARLVSLPVGPLPWGTNDVELRLRRGSTLVVHARDPEGRPVEHFTVRAVSRLDRDSDATRVRARGPFDHGIAVVAGLEGGEWLVGIEFPTASRLVTQVQRVSVDGELSRIDVRTERAAKRMLRVVRPDGTPVPGTRVDLVDLASSPIDTNTEAVDLATYLRRTVGRSKFPIALQASVGATRPDGTCELWGSAARPQALRVLGPGHIAHCDPAVDLAAAGELVVTVQAGARLVARIEPPGALDELRRRAGIEPGGAFAARRAPSLQLFQPASAGEFERTWPADRSDPGAQLAADGRFTLDAIPPGEWQIGIVHWHIVDESTARLDRIDAQTLVFTEGGSREIAVDLGFVLPGTLEGLVQHNGRPMAATHVTVRAAAGQQSQSRSAHTDADGRFRVLLVPGRYTVHPVLGAGTPQRRSEAASGEAEVRRGSVVRQTFHLVTGELTLRLRRSDGSPAEGVVLCLGDDRPGGPQLPATDVEGATHIDSRPGSFTVFAQRSRDNHVAIGTVAVQAGESTLAELPLPTDW